MKPAKKLSIIAEIGSTHEGDVYQMLTAIEEAKRAGADFIKFQWVSDAKKFAARRNAKEYEDAYSKIQFDAQILRQLRAACDEADIKFGCTVYLPEDVAVVAPYTEFYKISSFENEDRELYEAVLRAEPRPILISLGMLSMSDAIKIRCCRLASYRAQFLHCISSYPASIDELQLSCLKQDFIYGLSDHSRNLLTGAVAVGAGASILETHVRCANTPRTNADYEVSFTWEEFKAYVQNARIAERMVGKSKRTVTRGEYEFTKYKVKGEHS